MLEEHVLGTVIVLEFWQLNVACHLIKSDVFLAQNLNFRFSGSRLDLAAIGPRGSVSIRRLLDEDRSGMDSSA